jgi:hypothetical protein
MVNIEIDWFNPHGIRRLRLVDDERPLAFAQRRRR